MLPEPVPSSAFRAASSLSTCDVAVTLSSSFWMSSTGVLRSFSAPEANSSSMAPARACIPAILSWARCMAWRRNCPWSPRCPRRPRPPWSGPRPRCSWPSCVSFLVRNCSTRVCSCWEVSTSFCSCSVIWSCWALSSASCSPRAARRDSASRARSSLLCCRAALAWPLELVGLLLQPLGLQLDPLAGRGHVGHAPPDLLQLLQLLLVGEVERVAGVFGLVQHLVGLRLEDPLDSLPGACHGNEHKAQRHRGGQRPGRGRPPPLRSAPCLTPSACSPCTRTPTTSPPRGRARWPATTPKGVRTVLVCCTGGEEGDILNPAMDTPEVRADIGRVRMAELKAATDIIGYDETVMLGYRDSGMPDTEANARPDSFAQAPLDEAVERLVAIIRRERPQVILTYPDEQTEYPHPDHLRVHEISLVAFDAAGDPDRFPEAGRAVRPARSSTTRSGRPSGSARSTPSSSSWDWSRPSTRSGWPD